MLSLKTALKYSFALFPERASRYFNLRLQTHLESPLSQVLQEEHKKLIEKYENMGALLLAYQNKVQGKEPAQFHYFFQSPNQIEAYQFMKQTSRRPSRTIYRNTQLKNYKCNHESGTKNSLPKTSANEPSLHDPIIILSIKKTTIMSQPQSQPQVQSQVPQKQDTMDQIDQHLQQNEQNLLTIENFLEHKQMELNELQRYLVKEFEDMELWKSGKERLSGLWAGDVKGLLHEVRAFVRGLVGEFRGIFGNIITDFVAKVNTKLIQTHKQIHEKDIIIEAQAKKIEKLTMELQKNQSLLSPKLSNQMHSPMLSQMPSLKEISREISRTKFLQSNPKSLSKSSFLDLPRSKSKQKQRQPTTKSPHFEKTPQKILSSFKNLPQLENKLIKSPTVKKIMYEVHKNIKEDYENNCKVQIEHKRYVKEKIECLKNKNSGIFTDYRPMKGDRKF